MKYKYDNQWTHDYYTITLTKRKNKTTISFLRYNVDLWSEKKKAHGHCFTSTKGHSKGKAMKAMGK